MYADKNHESEVSFRDLNVVSRTKHQASKFKTCLLRITAHTFGIIAIFLFNSFFYFMMLEVN